MYKVKIGTILVPRRNSNGHNYVIGSKCRVTQVYNNGSVTCVNEAGRTGNALLISDCDIMVNKKMLKAQLKKINKDIQMFEMKKEFLIDTGKDVVKDNEIISWYIMKLINKKTNESEIKLSKIINMLSNDINIKTLTNI